MTMWSLPIVTENDSRDRDERVLSSPGVEVPDRARYLIDDVAVSGKTLDVARQALRPLRSDDISVVGLAFDSKRLRRRAGEVRSAILYRQDGGGRAPVNSLSTLVDSQSLRYEYATRYFGQPSALEEISDLYKGEE